MALAVLGGSGVHVLRTTNGGGFWDDLTNNLPNAAAHGVAAARSAGAVYVATDKGIFFASADLENAGPSAVTWAPISASLPEVPSTDVKLDANGYQLYTALDGYGVYATAAPHRLRTPRLLNAADFSTRAAAPGSLISVVGGRVSAATAGSLSFSSAGRLRKPSRRSKCRLKLQPPIFRWLSIRVQDDSPWDCPCKPYRPPFS